MFNEASLIHDMSGCKTYEGQCVNTLSPVTKYEPVEDPEGQTLTLNYALVLFAPCASLHFIVIQRLRTTY